MQCCTCSKWVYIRCSQLSLSKFRALGSSHSWSCHLCRNTVTSSSDSSDMYTSTVQSIPPSANAALQPHLCLQTSYPPSVQFTSSLSVHSPPFVAPGCPPAPPLPLTLSRLFNGMLKVFEPKSLNYFIFFRLILSTLFASRNPILTHFPLSRFLDSLLCVFIAPIGLVSSVVMPRTLAAALSFLLGRVYFFLNPLPPLFFCLIPTLIM